MVCVGDLVEWRICLLFESPGVERMLLESSQSSEQTGLPVLSSVLDGEASRQDVAQACKDWRAQPDMQSQWQTWALIGDVLRSDELASSPARDQQFLTEFRAKLAREPVVFAPLQAVPMATTQAAARHRRRWLAPTAVAAGVVAVVGALGVMRTVGDVGDPASAVMASSVPASAVDANGMVLVRNPQLDSYLNAHRRYAQVPALAPTNGLQQVSATSNGR
jgi:sigma-E factor negative regulatory protein RseA